MLSFVIPAYCLIAMANIETMIGIILALTAMMTDKHLRQKSNLMIVCLLLPDVVRVAIGNLHVIEHYHPHTTLLSDTTCLVVIHWGMVVCPQASKWLLTAIAIHRYLLCVKLRLGIDDTKKCLAISLFSFAAPVVIALVLGSINEWLKNDEDMLHGDSSSILKPMLTMDHEMERVM